MRDLSPSPLDITSAVFASTATMPRKSRVSPPATCRRFQDLPSSLEKRITPFEPQTHTTMGCGLCASGPANTDATPAASAALTPRRLVSIPLVCTDQWTSSAAFTSCALMRSPLLESLQRGPPRATPHNTANTADKV